MVQGSVVGIVLENQDPTGMHRVMVKFPVSGGGIQSSWARMITPMSGAGRGLVMLPDIGTEVLLLFSHRTLVPYVMGALYNGEGDEPEPYKNDDGEDNKRVFWSRSDHLLVFDDTPGKEKIGLGAKAPTRLEVQSAPIHHTLDDANKKFSEYCDDTTLTECGRKLSIRCRSFRLRAERVMLNAGSDLVLTANTIQVDASAIVRISSPDTRMKQPGKAPTGILSDAAASALHPPSRTAA